MGPGPPCPRARRPQPQQHQQQQPHAQPPRPMHTRAPPPGPHPAGRWPPPTAGGRGTRSRPPGPRRCHPPHTGWRRTRRCLRRDGAGRGACGQGLGAEAAGHRGPPPPVGEEGPSLLPWPPSPQPRPRAPPPPASGHSPSAQVGPLQPDGQWHSKPEGTSWQDPPLAQGLEAQACSAAGGRRQRWAAGGTARGPALAEGSPPPPGPRAGKGACVQGEGSRSAGPSGPLSAGRAGPRPTYPARSSCPCSRRGRRSGTGPAPR